MSGSDAPYHVVTTEGRFHSAWHDLDVAKRRAARANENAKKLGIRARYEVRELLRGAELPR